MSTFIERHADWLREMENKMTDAKWVTHAARGKDLLSEAMSRLSLARTSLELIARNWIGEPFPSITCSEADALYMAMSHVGLPDELGDEFMMHHAYTDDPNEGDTHVILVDETGTPVGWTQHYPDDVEVDDPTPTSPEMFEAVGLVFYDPVTDSLATDHRQPTHHEGEPL